MDYFCYTFNNLPRINEIRSRNYHVLPSNPISVIRYRSSLSDTTMYIPKSGSLYPIMVLEAKPLHVKAALVAYSVMPTRMSTIRSRTHASF
jgi:hypothetical protein